VLRRQSLGDQGSVTGFRVALDAEQGRDGVGRKSGGDRVELD
jgi:hypothetical protein